MERTGGIMADIDLVKVRSVLLKGLRVMTAVRVLAKETKRDHEGLEDLEREFRECAHQVGLLERSIVEDRNQARAKL